MQATQSFSITAYSAASTFNICARQAVKDSARLYQIARPIILYAVATLYVLGRISYASGQRFRAWSDNLVESNLTPHEQPAPSPTPIAPPAPIRAVAKAVPAPMTLVVKPEPVDLSALNLTELRAIAKKRGVSIRAIGVDRRLNKKELLAALGG